MRIIVVMSSPIRVREGAPLIGPIELIPELHAIADRVRTCRRKIDGALRMELRRQWGSALNASRSAEAHERIAHCHEAQCEATSDIVDCLDSLAAELRYVDPSLVKFKEFTVREPKSRRRPHILDVEESTWRIASEARALAFMGCKPNAPLDIIARSLAADGGGTTPGSDGPRIRALQRATVFLSMAWTSPSRQAAWRLVDCLHDCGALLRAIAIHIRGDSGLEGRHALEPSRDALAAALLQIAFVMRALKLLIRRKSLFDETERRGRAVDVPCMLALLALREGGLTYEDISHLMCPPGGRTRQRWPERVRNLIRGAERLGHGPAPLYSWGTAFALETPSALLPLEPLSE